MDDYTYHCKQLIVDYINRCYPTEEGTTIGIENVYTKFRAELGSCVKIVFGINTKFCEDTVFVFECDFSTGKEKMDIWTKTNTSNF